MLNLFIADLQPILQDCIDKIKIDDTASCLLLADDIPMFSKSDDGLQKKVEKLEKYYTVNKVRVN